MCLSCVNAERRSCHGGMMTAAGWIVAVDKLIETEQIVITNCDANFAVGQHNFKDLYYTFRLQHLDRNGICNKNQSYMAEGGISPCFYSAV